MKNTNRYENQDPSVEVRRLFMELDRQQRELENQPLPEEKVQSDRPVFDESYWMTHLLYGVSEEPEKAEETDAPYAPMPLFGEDEMLPEEEDAEELPDAPIFERPLSNIGQALAGLFPRRGDRPVVLLRKTVCWLLAVAVLVGTLVSVWVLWWSPLRNKAQYDALAQRYRQADTGVLTAAGYPEGMLCAFQGMYVTNPDVGGWLTYTATGAFDIQYPVMHSSDGQKYKTVDFYEKKNRNGALYFDKRNTLRNCEDRNKVLIVYGNSAVNGQMLAGLNTLIGNVHYARAASVFSLDTLFSKNMYKVFAVVLYDETSSNGWSCLRTSFASDEAFLNYVDDLRAHSLYTYPTDVVAQDELAVITTAADSSAARFSGARIAVIGRRIRSAEYPVQDAAEIGKNEDVLMPAAWYDAQDLPLPTYSTSPTVRTTSSATETTTQTESTESTESTTQTEETLSEDVKTTTTRRPAGTTRTTTTRKVTTVPPTTTTTTTASSTTAQPTTSAGIVTIPVTKSTAPQDTTTEATTTGTE